MGLESSTLRWLLRRQVRRMAEELKEWGINPHANETHAKITAWVSETDHRTGEMQIFALSVLSKETVRHEGVHRAHILNTHVPTPEMRKKLRGKYMAGEDVPRDFEAISEALAGLAERNIRYKNQLVRTLDMIYKAGRGGKFLHAVRKRVLHLWEYLDKKNVPHEEKRWAIMQALYHSKNLRELNENIEAVKIWAELKKSGIRTSVREALAMKRLGRWK